MLKKSGIFCKICRGLEYNIYGKYLLAEFRIDAARVEEYEARENFIGALIKINESQYPIEEYELKKMYNFEPLKYIKI